MNEEDTQILMSIHQELMPYRIKAEDVYLNREESQKAKQLAQEAFDLFTELRMKQEVRKAQALLDEIAAQQKQAL